MLESEEELQEPTKKKRDKPREKKKKKKKKKKQQEDESADLESDPVDPDSDPVDLDCVVLRGIFKLGKKSHDVLLSRTTLTWTPITPEDPTAQCSVLCSGRVRLCDVIAVKVRRRRGRGQTAGGALLGLTLFCCRRRGRSLSQHALHLHNASETHTHTWLHTVRELLRGFTRPRSLKVFINPGSHKKEAVHIYREQVAPLFKMADITTDIAITDKKADILSVLKECPLDEFDGLVCIGGDGSVAELSHALVLRSQLDANNPEEPVRAQLPLGIIPAGSTDVVSCSVHGVRDPVTAAMHIVLGHLQQVDMCSFSSHGRLVRYGFSAMFGFGGRSLALAETKRWMPSSRRREYALVNTLARLRPEDCELSFLPVKEFEQGQQEQDQDSEGEESWRTNQGLYLSISIMSIPCLSPHAPRGLAPNTRVANGSAALIAVENTSRSEFIKHLKRYSSSSGQFSFSFVETHSVSAVRLRLRAEEDEGDVLFPWNIDGELVELANDVLVRVHPRLINLYGEEVEEAEEPLVSCSCI